MKKITQLLIAIFLGFALSVSTAFAKQYCHEPLTKGANTIYLSCENPSEGSYLLTIQSDVAMTRLSDGVYCHINNNTGNFQIGKNTNHTVSADKKTITSTILSTTPPVPYTPLYVLMPGEVIFTWPTDIDWTGTCAPVGPPDTEIPTAFTASLGAVSAGSVELLLNATDNSGAVVYTVSYGATPTIVTKSGTSGTEKSFIVTGLEQGTDYTFSIVAKDAAGNAAANNPLSVTATTTSMLAAPTPIIDASKVISMFSNAYTNVPVTTWKTDWSVAGALTDIQITGNDTKKYEGVTYVGIETTGANIIDASTMLYFNVDILTDNVTSLKIKLVDFGANGVYNGVGQVDDKEHELTFVPSLTGWNSYKIPLADFTGLTTKAHMAQYIITAAPAGTSSFYLDNMYFSTETGTSVSSIYSKNNISYYPNPVMNQLTISAQSKISQLIIRNVVGQTLKTIDVNDLVKSIDLSDLSAGNYFVTIQLNNGQLSTQKVVKL